MKRRTFNGILAAGAMTPLLNLIYGNALAQGKSQAGSTLRIGMTLSDVPLTTGQASQGFEGVRFISNSLYDGLIRWDLSRDDAAAKLVPGLAESWQVDPENNKRWVFNLRKGVKFHDGSDFNADAVIWNLDKLLKRDAPHFDQPQSIQATPQTASIESYRKLDDYTVEIVTREADAVQPYYMVQIYMSSPARWQELGGDWGKFANNPSGTGPFIMTSLTPRARVEMRRNDQYWDSKRVPKVEKLVLHCMPDSNTRAAALLSGQIDWAEAPAPDTIPRLKSSGQNISSNIYPHIWPWAFSFAEDSPFKDVKVRQAANLAVDRDGLVAFLGGLAVPAKGMVDDTHPWFGNPGFKIGYDLERARALMKEAGYGPDKPCKVKVVTSPSGSGQMQPLPMNEFIQENLREAYFDVQLDVLDWETLRARRRAMASGAENRGVHALNQSWAYWDPNIGLLGLTTPGGYNWSEWEDTEALKLAAAARVEFDAEKQTELLRRLHERMVDEAIWLWVVHDLNPRALSGKVKGFVQAQSWHLDLTPVTLS
jgi:peptide/nickel transport system substrate-binding protein